MCGICEAQRWVTHYEGGNVSRTCCFWADLQVATHIIRPSQPHMISVLDFALADARTFAHRFLYQDFHYTIETGTIRVILPNHGRILGDGPALEQSHGHLALVQPRGASQDQGSGSFGRTAPSGEVVDQSRIPSTPTSTVPPTNKDGREPKIYNPYSQESQRKIGNAMAIAAHAIGEGAALTEGTSNEPKPPILIWAAPNPETLQIGGCAPEPPTVLRSQLRPT